MHLCVELAIKQGLHQRNGQGGFIVTPCGVGFVRQLCQVDVASKRPPNLTNLGRASDETVVLHMAKYGSRTLRVTANRLSNVQGQTRRFRSQCANQRFVRLVSVIN